MKIFLLTAFIFIQVSFSQETEDELRETYFQIQVECDSLEASEKNNCLTQLNYYEKLLDKIDAQKGILNNSSLMPSTKKVGPKKSTCDNTGYIAGQAGQDLKRFSKITYVGHAVTLGGMTVTLFNPVAGVIISISGGFIQFFAPYQVHKAGAKLEKIEIYSDMDCSKFPPEL